MNLFIINVSDRSMEYGIGVYNKELVAALQNSSINIYIVNVFAKNLSIEMGKFNEVRYWNFPGPIPAQRSLNISQQYELYYRNIVYLLKLYIIDKRDLIFHLNINTSFQLAEELHKAFACNIIAVIHYSVWGLDVFDNLPRFRKMLKNENPNELEKYLKKSVEEERNLYEKVDHIICLSNYICEILYADYELDPKKIIVIPNGLTDKTDEKSDINILQKKWNIQRNEKIILFVGRMDEIKGLSYLIKAFRTLLKSCPKCRLVIVGNGSYDKYTKEAQDICTKITYTGFLDKTQLYEWYSLADVGVVPSLFEPFGYVAVEMMMHGLPVVATATSGLNEVVDDTCALKVPLNIFPDRVEIDTNVLADKILYLLQHPMEAKRLGQNGRKRYLKEYTSDVFRRNMLNFYQSL